MNGTSVAKKKIHSSTSTKAVPELNDRNVLEPKAVSRTEPIHAEPTHLEQAEETVSLFRTNAFQRRLAQLGQLDLQIRDQGLAASYDQKPWSLLYKALTDSIGADPKTFQLIYPFTSWNWVTQQVGFSGAAQYNFCAAVPQWSAVGNYNSSGDMFNQAFQEFLNVIVASTDDPQLRVQISQAADKLTLATNDYTTVYNQAVSAYNDSVANNDPPFDKWLGTPPGKGWQTQIIAKGTTVDQAQKNYNNLVDQANTPGLADAQNQFKNQDFYSKLTDPGLSSFPKVPNWSASDNPSSWVDRIKAGQGPAGATMGFTNRDASYDYSNTWAGGSISIKQVFWQVNVSGQWQSVTEFESDQELEVSIEFEAIDQIQIQPSPWYNGSFVRSKANGPFKKGYSAYGGDGNQAVFGEKGFVGLLKTGMFVGYKPTFTIKTSQSSFSSFLNKFKTSTGVRIGPFTFEASGGMEKAGWTYSSQGQTFTGTSTSETPLILGVTISELPQVNANLFLARSEPQARKGVCYRFAGREGDILARGVSEDECSSLGGESWAPIGVLAPTIVTRDVHDVRVLPLHGDPVLTSGIGHMDFNGPNLALVRCGIFAQAKPLPRVGTEYVITGEYDDHPMPFRYTVRCTVAARPVSRFVPAVSGLEEEQQ